MAENKESELKASIDNFGMVRLLLDYTWQGTKQLNASCRLRAPTVKDRVDACRFSVENFDAEIIDVVIASVACSTLRFGQWQDNEGDKPTLSEELALNPTFIIDNFDYGDLVRLNALMGKGITHPLGKDQIVNLIDSHEIVPLHQPYSINGNTFNAAVRTRRPLVRDHITARSYSMEKWRHSFSDIIVAGTAASTMTFGTLVNEGDKPYLTNQMQIDLPYIVENLLYPDLLLLNQLLVKSPASSVSGAKP